MTETEERDAWVVRITEVLRHEILVGLRRGNPIPFGVFVEKELRYPLQENEAAVLEVLRESAQVPQRGECPGINARVQARAGDTYLLIESLVGGEEAMPPPPQDAPPDNIVTGQPCLQTEWQVRQVAASLKLLRRPATDDEVQRAVFSAFKTAYPGLDVAPDALRLTVEEVKVMVAENTLLQLYDFENGFAHHARQGRHRLPEVYPA